MSFWWKNAIFSVSPLTRQPVRMSMGTGLSRATTRGHAHHDALMELVDGDEDLNKTNRCHPIEMHVFMVNI